LELSADVDGRFYEELAYFGKTQELMQNEVIDVN
jgi:hypothetical protein